jgi:hypothetical protein
MSANRLLLYSLFAIEQERHRCAVTLQAATAPAMTTMTAYAIYIESELKAVTLALRLIVMLCSI